MTRSKRRGAKQHNYSDENPTHKPIHNQTQSHNQSQLQHQQSNLVSSSFPSTSSHQPPSGFKSQKNPTWVSRSRRYGSNQQTLDDRQLSEPTSSKTEVSNLNSEVGPSNSGEMKVQELENNQKPDLGSNKQGREDNEPEDELDDVTSRLEKIRLGVEQPELPEEQLMLNDQHQEDELLAMESIFGDNVIMLDKQGELRCFQIYIDLSIPSEFMVVARFNSSGGLSMKDGTADDFVYSFQVQYLPPIVMTCLLPNSYPSHLPPLFTISVQWLDSTKISRLCSMLDSIWMEQPGQEVIYQWVDWLQNSSLSHLGYENEIALGPYRMKYDGDRCAISTGVSLDVDIPSLRSYNDEQCHKNFLKNLHKCLICYNEYAVTFLHYL